MWSLYSLRMEILMFKKSSMTESRPAAQNVVVLDTVKCSARRNLNLNLPKNGM